jgi:ribosome maturation factor RimP
LVKSPPCALIGVYCRTEKWAYRPLFYLSPAFLKMAVMEQSGLTEKIASLGERAALGTGIEIAEIQVRGAGNARLVRVYIDKPQGVTHGDCELVSERLGKLLDEEDIVPEGSYTLEVSSPGIERKLSKPRDFERVIGRKIWLAFERPGESRTSLEGTLANFANGTLELEVASDKTIHIPLELVQKAKLKFEW